MVERYEMKAEIRFIHGSPNADGKWVKYSDYEALQAELSQTRRKALEEADAILAEWAKNWSPAINLIRKDIRALIEKEAKN